MKSRSALLLSALLGVAGLIHLASPRTFDRLIPEWLPGGNDFWIYGSGVAEVACAVAIAHPKSRRIGSWVATGLFVVVFPGNVKMALDATGGIERVITYARLPLQIPLIWWAISVARSTRKPFTSVLS